MSHKRQKLDPLEKSDSDIFYGTPITRSTSFKPIWNQEVRDEQGRKRLHGAFTGGWSAGYYNTVGSKEGWTPSDIKTSRDNRVKIKAMKPEDFMDEEDFREKDDYEKIQNEKYTIDISSDSDVENDSIINLFKSKDKTEEGIGYKLLRKMGWKSGQALGPKTQEIINMGDEAETKKEISIAPKLQPKIELIPRVDKSGLGYGLNNIQNKNDNTIPGSISTVIQRNTSTSTNTIKKKLKPRVVDYGEDEDEEWNYSIKPIKSTLKEQVIGMKQKMLSSETPVFISRKSKFSNTNNNNNNNNNNQIKFCNDGRPPLPGFIISESLDLSKQNQFPLISIPSNYIPGIYLNFKSSLNQKDNYESNSQLSILKRTELLNEKKLPGKSIFDYISTEQRDRISSITGNNNIPLGKLIKSNTNSIINQNDIKFIPIIDSNIAKIAINNSKTLYSSNISKQSRYIEYLKSQISNDFEKILLLKSNHPDRNHWIDELKEFEKIALFSKKPSDILASIFESSNDIDSISTTTHVLGNTNSSEEAANAGMYGPLTRVVTSFVPEPLLCKRLGIKFDYENSNTNVNSSEAPLTSHKKNVIGNDKDDFITIQDNKSEINEALESEKAPADLFSMVFGNDDA